MDYSAGVIWGILAVLAVGGGWLSCRRARRAGRGPVVGFLIGLFVTLVVILVGTALVTLLQPH